MISTIAPISCSAQKSIVSWVSRIPPIIVPAIVRRFVRSPRAVKLSGVGEAPTLT
jgi:hypothetical protein